jgi:hypothetical protein
LSTAGEIERSGGWDVGVAPRKSFGLRRFTRQMPERPAFPETHPLFQGTLPIAMGPLSEGLECFDLAVVVGAPVFRYFVSAFVAPLAIETGSSNPARAADPYRSLRDNNPL